VPQRILTILAIAILILSILAAGGGLFWPSAGQPFEFTAVTGEKVEITGSGLYRYDPLWGTVQAQAQDAATLFLGVPALAAALVWANRGSLRGRLLLAGVLGYFLYAYTTAAFGVWFNPLFLVYVALFGLSINAVAPAAAQIDMRALPAHCADGFPRKGIIALCFGTAAFLSSAWLGRIVPDLFSGNPPYGLESYTTLFIQVMDLGVVVPLAVVGGILLWRRTPLGYLLSSVLLVKGAGLGVALTAMIVNPWRTGQEVSLAEAGVFIFLAAAILFLSGKTLASIREAVPGEKEVGFRSVFKSVRENAAPGPAFLLSEVRLQPGFDVLQHAPALRLVERLVIQACVDPERFVFRTRPVVEPLRAAGIDDFIRAALQGEKGQGDPARFLRHAPHGLPELRRQPRRGLPMMDQRIVPVGPDHFRIVRKEIGIEPQHAGPRRNRRKDPAQKDRRRRDPFAGFHGRRREYRALEISLMIEQVEGGDQSAHAVAEQKDRLSGLPAPDRGSKDRQRFGEILEALDPSARAVGSAVADLIKSVDRISAGEKRMHDVRVTAAVRAKSVEKDQRGFRLRVGQPGLKENAGVPHTAKIPFDMVHRISSAASVSSTESFRRAPPARFPRLSTRGLVPAR
jgi:hypothetical protein